MLSNVPHVARNVWLRGNARYKSNSHRAMSHPLQATCGTLHLRRLRTSQQFTPSTRSIVPALRTVSHHSAPSLLARRMPPPA